MKIMIFGANGTAGSEVIRQAILDDEISEVFAVVRKSLDIEHPIIKTIIHSDFMNFTDLQPMFKEIDAVIWCLGVSSAKVKADEYTKITRDYAIAAANSLVSVNSNVNFVFLSGKGSDSTEKSKILFARVKGMTENALMKFPFNKFSIARPAFILPMNIPINMILSKKLEVGLGKLLGLLFPFMAISTVDLANVMLDLAKHGGDETIFENTDLRASASRLTNEKIF